MCATLKSLFLFLSVGDVGDEGRQQEDGQGQKNGIIPINHINPHFISSFVTSAFLSASQSVSQHSASSKPSSNPLVQEFLQKSCGLSEKQATSASKRLLHLKSARNLRQVLQFFKDCGFADEQIQNIVARRPQVLASSVHKTLEPKVRVLENLGIVGTQLGDIISKGPALLSMSLEKKLVPGISFLRNMVESDERVAKVLMREPRILYVHLEKRLKSNLLFLENNGVDRKSLWIFLVRKPRFLISTESVIEEVLNTVVALGFPRHSGMFPHAVFVVSSMAKKTLERKMNTLIALGLTKEEVLRAFKRSPFILATSEKKLESHMHFLINTLKCEPSVIVSYPHFFTASMEARIMPRYRILQTLQSMQLLQESYNVMNMISTSEKRFLDKFVFKYDESLGLYEIYKGMDSTSSSPHITDDRLILKEGECKKGNYCKSSFQHVSAPSCACQGSVLTANGYEAFWQDRGESKIFSLLGHLNVVFDKMYEENALTSWFFIHPSVLGAVSKGSQSHPLFAKLDRQNTCVIEWLENQRKGHYSCRLQHPEGVDSASGASFGRWHEEMKERPPSTSMSTTKERLAPCLEVYTGLSHDEVKETNMGASES
eukprot:Gb_12989 [translate_table: standard]